MNEITITSGEQTIQFSNRAITVDGTEHPYSGITQFWHLPEHDSYAFQCDGEMVALPYEEKDASLMTALITRITQTLEIPIEDHYSPGGGEGDEGEDAEEDAEVAGAVEVAGEGTGEGAEGVGEAAGEGLGDAAEAAGAVADEAAGEPDAVEGGLEEVAGVAGAAADEAAGEPAAEEGGLNEVAGVAGAVADEAAGEPAAAGLFSDKRFVIELVAGILLIILGIVGFILWK